MPNKAKKEKVHLLLELKTYWVTAYKGFEAKLNVFCGYEFKLVDFVVGDGCATFVSKPHFCNIWHSYHNQA